MWHRQKKNTCPFAVTSNFLGHLYNSLHDVVRVQPLSQPAGGEIPPMNGPTAVNTQLKQGTHTKDIPRATSSWVKWTAPLGPTKLLLYKHTP